MRYVLIITLLFLFVSPALAERYEYYAEVNQVIPDFDSVGVTDTIFIPVHAIIEDINFYVGIGTIPEPWAEDVWVDVYSPYGGMVRLVRYRSGSGRAGASQRLRGARLLRPLDHACLRYVSRLFP